MRIRDAVALKVSSNGTPITSIAATLNSDAIDLSNYVEAIAWIPVSAHAGTNPTLDCKIQYSPDYDPTNPGAATWADSGDSFTQITTSNGGFFKRLTSNFGKWVRLGFTLGGTGSPSYTTSPVIVVKS